MADIGKYMTSSVPGFVPPFGETGRKQFEAALEVQSELLGTIEEVNRAWLTRAQSELKLVSEFVGKLATARTVPEATAACQECMNRQMETFAENSREMLAEGEKLIRVGARFFSDGSRALSS